MNRMEKKLGQLKDRLWEINTSLDREVDFEIIDMLCAERGQVMAKIKELERLIKDSR